MKPAIQPKNSPYNSLANEKAQRLLKDREEGYVPYDGIITSEEEIVSIFPVVTSGDVLNMTGNSFYWRRVAGAPMILYGENSWDDQLKGKGIIEICRMKLPEEWIGAGRFIIDWPRPKKNETRLLITLYLYSPNAEEFQRLIVDETELTAFMATLYLDVDNAEIFNQLAEERYCSLR